MSSSKSFVKYFVNSFAMKLSIILALLFFLLTPGVILSLPPASSSCSWYPFGLFNTPATGCEASNIVAQAAVHALVFGLVTFLTITQVFKRR